MKVWTLTKEGLEQQADDIKDIVIGALVDDGLLEAQVGIQWAKTHTIIVRQRSTISQWLKNLAGKEEESYSLIVAAIPLEAVEDKVEGGR